MSIIQNNLLMTPEGYQISRSVRLRSSASAYFNRTPASSGTRTKATISLWVKRGAISSRTPLVVVRQGATDYFILEFQSDNTLQAISVTSSTTNTQLVTTQVFRDPSAWYHIVFTYDSTVATPNSSSIYLSVNGVKVTALSTATYPSQNTNLYYNIGSVEHDIGKLGNLTTYADCYLTEINSTDGQASAASSFGETDAVTGVWKPKKYAGTYGTNGFYLNFSDNSNNTAATIGKDYSGNGNNWTPNNISVTSGVTYDSMLDVPTPYADGGNGRGNYCVLNPLNIYAVTPSNGNLTASGSNAGYRGTMAIPSSGKWYWETVVTTLATQAKYVGIGQNNSLGTGVRYEHDNGQKVVDGTNSAYGATWTANDVIGVAVDADGGTVTFYKNNVSQGSISYTFLTTDFYVPVMTSGGTVGSDVIQANFGQRPFTYTPPTGFKALNTQNLPDSTIKKGNQYFDVSTFTGNGGAQTITGLAFQPDFVWLKPRSTANSHGLYDSVRGATKYLSSNGTGAEATYANSLISFNSDGYSIGSDVNINAASFVGWQWKESATAGFDIVTQTLGTTGINTMSHSLGVAPRMILAKRRDSTEQWLVYHASATTQSQYLGLNTTAAVTSSANLWGSSSISSTQFFFSGTSGNQYVFYLFADVAGFSRFGSYTGNGSTDGPFVYCGFRPRWVLLKQSSGAGSWTLWDTARDAYNQSTTILYPHLSNAETTGVNIDVLSNGFKLRHIGDINASSTTVIFAAFAENPFKNSLAR